jgi:tRNA 2-thiouridine synthesizing protein E
MSITSQTIMNELDENGYLINADIWTTDIAIAIAQLNGIKLNDEHWVVIHYLRRFFQEFPTIKIPAMRVMIKALREELGESKGNSLYFHQLFPEGLVQAYKIAGLPKTGRCSKNAF